jgi:methionyl-tRNA synthetase
MAQPDLEQYHFIGKDIVTFHTLFWPAMLHFSGRKAPDKIFVHGFLTVNNGEKMSKSRGTGLDPLKYLSLGMNPEWLRYYLATKLSARNEDIDFNADDFLARVNSDLIGKFVNIASRAAGFLVKNFDGHIGFIGDSAHLIDGGRNSAFLAAQAYEARDFGKALREIMTIADGLNASFDAAKPWVLAKDESKRDELQDICSRVLHGFKLLSVLLTPVLPALTEKVAKELFMLDRSFTWDDASPLPSRVAPYQHLMQRVTPEQLEALFEPPAKLGPEPEKLGSDPDFPAENSGSDPSVAGGSKRASSCSGVTRCMRCW